MQQFPIFLNMNDFPCAVVGRGDVAFRKLTALLKSQAVVSLIAPTLCKELSELKHDNLTWIESDYKQELIADMRLVVAATDNQTVNHAIYTYCEANKILINAVDQPEICRYTTPSIIDRSPVVIAISSAGSAPVLARRLRAKLEVLIPRSIGELATYASHLRGKIKQEFSNFASRRLFWERFFNSRLVDDFDSLTQQERVELTQDLIKQEQQDKTKGEVCLVGAGPGDSELLTIKALQKMQLADVILYDRLVSKEVLDLARKDAEFICVGKQKGFHSKPQDDINNLLVEHALKGKKVCRLKGGDPFIFGRGGEELETLVEHNIPFQVVPAVTAAAGCSAYSGIPLTHRDHAQSVVFVTGHCRNEGEKVQWQALSTNQTIVIYMGLTQSAGIQAQLLKQGLAADMPVALVENGATPDQRVTITQLDSLASTVVDKEIKSPALIIVGTVVSLYDKLAWYKTQNNRDCQFAELDDNGNITYKD